MARSRGRGEGATIRPPTPDSRPGVHARLDELLVERGLAGTRAEAARVILAGRVRLPGGRAAKAGQRVRRDAAIELTTAARFVSRGGEKLVAALLEFGVSPAGRTCLDVGASTGGFTDCLLAWGARRVYAVDVGHGQLHPRLRADPRVVVLEHVNARYLSPGRIPEAATLATIDVAFIALRTVLPAVAACVASRADLVALVKPQFEVGRGRVGKGGVVRDPRLHAEVLLGVAGAAEGLGLSPRGVIASPIRGPKGNREFFLHLERGGEPGARLIHLEAAVEAAVAGGEP